LGDMSAIVVLEPQEMGKTGGVVDMAAAVGG
jgi:hypothetical protein